MLQQLKSVPLAARMRPTCLQEFVGQEQLLGPAKALFSIIQKRLVHSMILWGPPGVGKTTLACLLAEHCGHPFRVLSAVQSGISEIRAAVEISANEGAASLPPVLFVDEVHRFNKMQQDVFLPQLERGDCILVGATTENPSFSLNNALLSRLCVYQLLPLGANQVEQIIERALFAPEGLGLKGLTIAPDALRKLAQAADGDGRVALNLLERLADALNQQQRIEVGHLESLLLEPCRRFDRTEQFYDQLSAFHKSVRGSSPDGALYWYARLVEGGVDPLVIARRLLAIASEDIGNADPRALQLCLAAWDTYARIGGEDGQRAIAQAAIFCAVAPKSNSVYSAWKKARQQARNSDATFEVPMHLRVATNTVARALGYGKKYRYVHDEPDGYAPGVNYLPQQLKDMQFYEPSPRGLEIKIGEKLRQLRSKDRCD